VKLGQGRGGRAGRAGDSLSRELLPADACLPSPVAVPCSAVQCSAGSSCSRVRESRGGPPLPVLLGACRWGPRRHGHPATLARYVISAQSFVPDVAPIVGFFSFPEASHLFLHCSQLSSSIPALALLLTAHCPPIPLGPRWLYFLIICCLWNLVPTLPSRLAPALNVGFSSGTLVGCPPQRLKSVRKFAHILPGLGTGYPDMKKKRVKPGSLRQTRVPTRVEVASRASRMSHRVPLVADHDVTTLPIRALPVPVHRGGRGRPIAIAGIAPPNSICIAQVAEHTSIFSRNFPPCVHRPGASGMCGVGVLQNWVCQSASWGLGFCSRCLWQGIHGLIVRVITRFILFI
jgi:hypothetical protein